MICFPHLQNIPENLTTEYCHIRPLLATDVELDFAAVVTSRDYLHTWSQDEWPAENFSLEDNLKDLVEHEQEHIARIALTFTILTRDQQECLGCIYLKPVLWTLRDNEVVAGAETTPSDTAGKFAFWVVPDAMQSGMDKTLLNDLFKWFRTEWRMESVFVQTNEKDQHQLTLYESSGLAREYALKMEGDDTLFYLYG